MLSKIALIGSAFSFANAGFVDRLFQEPPEDSDVKINIEEFYGRLPNLEDPDGSSTAYLTALISYELETEQLRFHFNMKEPWRKIAGEGEEKSSSLIDKLLGKKQKHDKILAETDLQWNTMMDLSHTKYMEPFVNFEEQTINVSNFITVFGFSKDRMNVKKTCQFEILFKEINGEVTLEMEASPLRDDLPCLHRDVISSGKLEAEQDKEIMKRDNLFFKNLEALEFTLDVASFAEEGVEGTWIVSQDDLLMSKSKTRNFFKLTENLEVEDTMSTVFYTLQDYDLVGPEDFHFDRSLDKLRNNVYNKPWLNVEIKFLSVENGKKPPVETKVTMIFPLEDAHMLISKAKRSFRATKPYNALISSSDNSVHATCDSLTFYFQVRSEYVRYIIQDQEDQCFPYTVEGKWYLDLSEEEKLEEIIENSMQDSLQGLTETEKQDLKIDNDELVDRLGQDFDNLTEEQKAQLNEVVDREWEQYGDLEELKELKQKQKDKWLEDYVIHDDFDAKKEKQSDWYMRGRGSRTKMTKEERLERVEERFEFMGALYATAAISVIGCCYYYLCVRRKNLRNNPEYAHVVPTGPGFA